MTTCVPPAVMSAPMDAWRRKPWSSCVIRRRFVRVYAARGERTRGETNTQNASMTAKHPSVKWAEREDKVYMTFELADAKDVEIAIEKDKITFSASSGGEQYAETIAFYKAISSEKSTYAVTARQVFCVLVKEDAEWWSRLLPAAAGKMNNVHVDFDKWADEDDDEAQDIDTSGFDMQSMMAGMGGGAGGMPGMMGGGGPGGGGMDMAALQAMMGGAGGAGGAPDFSSMMGGMGGGAGGGGAGGEEPSMDELKKLIANMKSSKDEGGLGAIEEEGDEDDLPELE